MPGFSFREKNGKKRIKDKYAKSPIFEIFYPNDASVFTSGDVCNIIWSCSNIDRTYSVKLELYEDNVFHSVIIDETSNNGLYSWTVPAVDGSTFQIKIVSNIDDDYYAYSENFTIRLDSSITLLSPNGSESWINESCYYITWQSIYLSGNVKIELYKNEILHSVITESVPCDLEIYEWYIPYTVFEDDDYKVKISSIESPTVFDFSNANFEIKRKVVWILTNKYYGSTIPYTDEAWILTNYKYPENTKDSNTNSTLLTNFSYPINDKDSNENAWMLTNYIIIPPEEPEPEYIVTLITPDHGDSPVYTNADAIVTFNWSTVANADEYDISIDEYYDVDENYIALHTENIYSTVNTTYQKNFGFVETPTLISPLNNETITGEDFTLLWNKTNNIYSTYMDYVGTGLYKYRAIRQYFYGDDNSWNSLIYDGYTNNAWFIRNTFRYVIWKVRVRIDGVTYGWSSPYILYIRSADSETRTFFTP